MTIPNEDDVDQMAVPDWLGRLLSNPGVERSINSARVNAVLGDLSALERLAYCNWQLTPNQSALGGVRDDLLPYTPDGLVGVCLLSWGDAMHASAQLWKASGQRTFPMAMGTLMRQAIFASATAIWLTSDGDPGELARRIALAAVKALDNSRVADQVVRNWSPDGDGKNALTATIRHKAERAEAVRKEFRLGNLKMPSDTDIWAHAARAAYPESSQQQARLNLAWREVSGDAHGLVWVPALRARLRGDTGQQSRDNPRRYTITTTLDTKEYAVLVEDARLLGSLAIKLAIRRGLRASKPVALGG